MSKPVVNFLIIFENLEKIFKLLFFFQTNEFIKEFMRLCNSECPK